MKRRVLYFVIALAALLPLMVSAQTESSADEEHDFLEVGLQAGLGIPFGSVKTWNDTLGAKAGLNLGGEIGMYLNKDYVLGFQFNYYQMKINTSAPVGNLKHRLYSNSVYLKRYFSSNSNFVPYVKVNAGIDFPKFTTWVIDGLDRKFRELSYKGAFGAGLGAGMFYYTSDFGGFYVEADYHHTFSNGVKKDYADSEYKFPGTISMLDIKAGVRVFFGGGD
jgi:hypothetical protein